VQPRKYRLRFLNAAISRSFFLYFERADQTGRKLPFDVIASDAGLLSGPQRVNDMYISMAERYEVVFDFAPFKGKKVTLRNTDDFSPDKEYLHTNKVMQFVVSNDAVTDPSEVRSSFRTIPYPPSKPGVDHHFRFEKQGGQWTINGVTWADVNNRVMAKPARGTIETWELENSSGGWSHPIHVHLVDFQVVKRTGGRSVMPYEAAGLKDVVWLGPGETVTVRAHYAPWDGVYMFHCHNLIHEDHAMMAAFNVTVLEDFGYNETHYIDPMEPRWRAKKEVAADQTYEANKARVEFMASFEPYNNVAEVEDRLEDYWKTRGQVTQSSTSTTRPVTTTPLPKVASSTSTQPATVSNTKGKNRRRFPARHAS
jgi:bilirubin oxidase